MWAALHSWAGTSSADGICSRTKSADIAAANGLVVIPQRQHFCFSLPERKKWEVIQPFLEWPWCATSLPPLWALLFVCCLCPSSDSIGKPVQWFWDVILQQSLLPYSPFCACCSWCIHEESSQKGQKHTGKWVWADPGLWTARSQQQCQGLAWDRLEYLTLPCPEFS